MSAAEKLKALVIEDERIGSEIGSNARKKFRSQNWPLPQIVAVVEAAENAEGWMVAVRENELETFLQVPLGEWLPVVSALAALDAVLTK